MRIAELLQRQGLHPSGRVQRQAGEFLFRSGQRVTAFFVIVRGQCRLVRTDRHGGEVTLHRAGSGEALAEPSLFAERYHCDALAMSATELLVYSRADIATAMGSDPVFASSVAAHLAGLVHQARSRAEILSHRGARERVLAYIRMHLPPDGHALDINQPWKTLASEIGLTHEALYRALAGLQKDGLLRREGRRVALLEG